MNTQTPEKTTGPALDAAFARRWLAEFVARFSTEAKVLADLDRQAGDGDFGTNLSSALGRAQRFVESNDPQTFADVLFAVSKGFLNTGGTSGPLFGMWFRDLAKAATTEPVTAQALAEGVAAGLATIQRLGGAQVGDNTMVDAITPAAEALARSAGRVSLGAALIAAADAAATGARTTRDLIANRGRASYVGELARGVLDPGAVAVALLFAAAVTTHGDPTPDTSWLTAPS